MSVLKGAKPGDVRPCGCPLPPYPNGFCDLHQSWMCGQANTFSQCRTIADLHANDVHQVPA